MVVKSSRHGFILLCPRRRMRWCKTVYDCAGVVETTWVRQVHCSSWYAKCHNGRLVVGATRNRQFGGMSQNWMVWMVLQWRTGWQSDTIAAWWLQVERLDGVKDGAIAHQLSKRQDCSMLLKSQIMEQCGRSQRVIVAQLEISILS